MIRRALTHPAALITASVLLACLIALSWLLRTPTYIDPRSTANMGLVAAALIVGEALSYHFPLSVRSNTKIEMGSVPLYLMAVLLPPPLAACTAALGTLAGEFSVREMRHTSRSDAGKQALRYCAVVFAGSLIAHSANGGWAVRAALLVATATMMLSTDILTLPVTAGPLATRGMVRIIGESGRSVILPETGQYAMGVAGAVLAADNPWAVTLLILPVALLYKMSGRARELHQSTIGLLENMADTVDGRDRYTYEHSRRVSARSQSIGRELSVGAKDTELLAIAARVHDIGKLSLPDSVIQSADHLSSQEWAMMQMHPAIGASMLARYPAFVRAAGIVRGHHERWDGKGYPDGLAGTDIPLGARIIAIADSFDAMISERHYRKAMTWERAAGILSAGRGTQWDPEVVNAFLRVVHPELELHRSSLAEAGGVRRNLPDRI
ncbi:MAG: HD-GYP domain-containing protein [Chloroflexota bacterium]